MNKPVLISAFVLFIVLAFFVKLYNLLGVDLAVSLYIQHINESWFDSLMKAVTVLGNAPVLIGSTFLIAILFFLIKKKVESVILIISVGGAGLLSEVLKHLIARPRPSQFLVRQMDHFTKPDSFPSGHVLAIIGLYGFLLILVLSLKKGLPKKILTMIYLVPIILIGVSRIYLGAHWLTDVLGAYLVGFLWLYFVNFIYRLTK